ncbi:hypothetical protein CAEBREN_29184 [Caenorhabditis brenneri]|uniref:Uncharacterized protein n=1 Tax=Caenorhabditis brenneri TaxID=135651 RepID=G0MFZ1_CAEBE|nr:hypothetical protein CAEBREN_29184 [Caenorhabditis brenneri]
MSLADANCPTDTKSTPPAPFPAPYHLQIDPNQFPNHLHRVQLSKTSRTSAKRAKPRMTTTTKTRRGQEATAIRPCVAATQNQPPKTLLACA